MPYDLSVCLSVICQSTIKLVKIIIMEECPQYSLVTNFSEAKAIDEIPVKSHKLGAPNAGMQVEQLKLSFFD